MAKGPTKVGKNLSRGKTSQFRPVKRDRLEPIKGSHIQVPKIKLAVRQLGKPGKNLDRTIVTIKPGPWQRRGVGVHGSWDPVSQTIGDVERGQVFDEGVSIANVLSARTVPD